jgi:hypothetical protein
MRPPPWSFPGARVLYQPSFVPVRVARAATPASGLTLLSLFGWTLGGVFVVEWTESPIGPYREVAVLSGLVARDFRIGAWASHIVVTTADAVESGRDLFGLPARLGSVDFEVGPDASASHTDAAEREGFYFASEDCVLIRGWDNWLPGLPAPAPEQGARRFTLTLPSFSGRLPTGPGTTPLLRYPLTLGGARRVRLRAPMSTVCSSGPALGDTLRGVLGGPCACPCIQVDGVQIVAGRPVEIFGT